MPNKLLLKRLQTWLLPVLLVSECIIFAILSPRFLTGDNLANIAYNAADLSLIAAGLTLVIILGGIDVSTGFAVGIVTWVAASLASAGYPPILIVLASVLTGGFLGAVNGTLVTYFKVPPIIATLGTAAIFQTVLFALWNSTDLFAAPIAPLLSGERAFGVPLVLVVVVAVYGLLYFIQKKRPFGRNVMAIGSNPEAAALAGVRQPWVVFACYLILGGLVGLAATIYVGRVGVVQASTGNELTLLAIAAVVVGGTSILGGEGSILRTLGGLAFIVILQNGVVLAGVPPLWNGLMIGVTILLAVSIDIAANAGKKARLFRGLV